MKKSAIETKGSVFIGIVLVIVLFAALAAGVVSLHSTAKLGSLAGVHGARAYYLAESGYRLTRNALTAVGAGVAMDNALARIITSFNTDPEPYYEVRNLHDSLLEKITLEITPYYLRTLSKYSTGTMQIRAYLPAKLLQPVLAFAPTNGRIRINSSDAQLSTSSTVDYQSVTAEADGAYRFTLATPLTRDLPRYSNILSVVRPASAQTVLHERDLPLQAGSADAFPSYRGVVEIGDDFYQYRHYDNDTLYYLERTADSTGSGGAVGTATDIVLTKSVQIDAIGTLDAGQNAPAIARQLTYYAPLPTRKKKIYENVDFLVSENAFTSGTGAHGSLEIGGGGDSTLKVTAIEIFAATGDAASLAVFNPGRENIDLVNVRRTGNGFLSYDAQIKVGFANPLLPVDAPLYFAAGLSFRLQEPAVDTSPIGADQYGLSYLRGSAIPMGGGRPGNISGIPDGLDSSDGDGLIPAADGLYLVLWKQVAGAQQWLAYKTLSDTNTTYFEFPFDGDAAVVESRWDRDPIGAWDLVVDPRPEGSGATWSYTGVDGTLTSDEIENPIQIPASADRVAMTLWTRFDADNTKELVVTNVSDATDQQVYAIESPAYPQGVWHRAQFDLTVFIGKTVTIAFRAEGTGSWFVDDLSIARQFPAENATIGLRLSESALLSFDSGGFSDGTGLNEIETGDVITDLSGAKAAVVIEAPLLELDGWASQTAKGTVLVRSNVESADLFSSGQDLYLQRNNSQRIAVVVDYQNRANLVQAFIATENAAGTAGSDAYDDQRLGYPRSGGILWPPAGIAGVSAANDYFTWVTWDAVHSDAAPISFLNASDTLIENGIIATAAITTENYSRASFPPELGLHTFGAEGQYVFFDDFAVQGVLSSTGGRSFGEVLRE